MRRFHGCNLRKGRVSISGQVYLVTAVAHKRTPQFREFEAAHVVVNALRWSARSSEARTLAYVLMPDHLHWLGVPAVEIGLSETIRRMKGRSALELNRYRGADAVSVWQRGFHDHALRKEEDLVEAARYLVANPIRAGLVSKVGDYPWWDAEWL
jgi:REP element-mobilizing transposase RayT